MKPPPSPASVWVVAALSVAGLSLMFAPADVVEQLRTTVRDTFRPGQRVVRSAWEASTAVVANFGRGADRTVELTALRDQLRDAEWRNRQLRIETSRLQEELGRGTSGNITVTSADRSTPLFRPELVEARVLGEETTNLWRGRKLLDAGETSGIIESALVLEARRPLLDLGADACVAPDQPVYAGRIVIGKIDVVGRWSSTLLRVTDAGYSGRARVARRTSQGMQFGSEGTLKGTGEELCELGPIPLSEPVAVGDEVYTGGTDGILPYPMFYGTVAKAAPRPGTDHWSISVKPAAADEKLLTVQILRTTVNPDRMLAN